MVRMIIDGVVVLLLAVVVTLSVVTWKKTGALEGQLAVVQKGLKETNKKIAEGEDHAKSANAKASHGANDAPHWAYEGEMGPDKWGSAFPVCGTGQAQSPVDIHGPFEKAAHPIKLNYKPTPLKVLNNGHTIQATVGPGSTLTVNNVAYELLQFHFHRPSEERIDGKPSAMVAHFVHKSAAGKLAVVGILLSEGKENPVVRSIWANAPQHEAPEVAVAGAEINPASMLPERLEYYSFEGSLTTPPCTEGVTFYIVKAATDISRAQIDAFPFKANARPVQPLNGRKVSVN